MNDRILLVPDEIFERTRALTKWVVANAPGSVFSLEDIMKEEIWLTVAASPFARLIPIYGALTGALEGLVERETPVDDVILVDMTAPPTTAVKPGDLRIAQSWLTAALEQNLDVDAQHDLVDHQTSGMRWDRGGIRLTSIVLSLVLIASDAVGPN